MGKENKEVPERKKKVRFGDDLDKEYIGNIFGWKFSFIGFGIIVFMLILYFGAAQYNKNNPREINTDTNANTPDSLVQEKEIDTLNIRHGN